MSPNLYLCSTGLHCRGSRPWYKVQLRKNEDFAKYLGKNCDSDVPKAERKRCKEIQSFSGNQFAIWFHSFISEKGGKLWDIFTSRNDMTITSMHYKNLHNLAIDSPNANWKKKLYIIIWSQLSLSATVF